MDKISFTAIDLETANSNPWSICQIGIVNVVNSIIVQSDSLLIQPPNNEYSHWNVCIHGISPDKTKNKPLFPEIWKAIYNIIEKQILVAHNISFDINNLRKTIEYYQLPKIDFLTDCTYSLTGLSLVDLCDALDIKLLKHHDALSDALACAEAYIKLKSGLKPDLGKIKERKPKFIFEGHDRIKGNLLKPDLEHADIHNLFYSKKVVFTGILDNLTREEAAKLIKLLGADIDTSVTKRTNFVIVGSGAGPSKLSKIEEFNQTGANIKILYENEFLKIIGK